MRSDSSAAAAELALVCAKHAETEKQQQARDTEASLQPTHDDTDLISGSRQKSEMA